MELKILTYNIFFEDIMLKDRLESLIKTIDDYDPDIICLQEVRPDVYEVLKNVFRSRCVYPDKINTSYDCVIISKTSFKYMMTYNYKHSKMNRKVIFCQIGFGGRLITIATTHCESIFNKRFKNLYKIKQFSRCEKLLNEHYNICKNVIMTGDFNIIDNDEQYFIDKINPQYKDLWKELGNKNNEFTYDSSKNICLQAINNKFYQSRLDRILYRCDYITPTKFELIKGIKGLCEPSDHYGILGVFKLKDI